MPQKLKDIDNAVAYLTSSDYYSNKNEANVKRILIENLAKYKEGKINMSFLAALCSELLYFGGNIGAFKDTSLRDVLIKGDNLSYLLTFEGKDSEISKVLETILNYS